MDRRRLHRANRTDVEVFVRLFLCARYLLLDCVRIGSDFLSDELVFVELTWNILVPTLL